MLGEKASNCFNNQHNSLQEPDLLLSMIHHLLKYFVFIAIVCLLSLMLGDFWYIVIFDLSFIVLNMHYGSYHSLKIINHYCLFMALFTLFPKLLLSISMNKFHIIMVALMCTIILIKGECIITAKKEIEFHQSMKTRKNIIVFMMFMIIIVMSVSYLKVAQMMTLSLLSSLIGLFCLKSLS